MNKQEKLISVIIPTYNRKTYILETIQSVLTQSYQMIECIIVDDASTDGTEEVVRKNVKDKRLRYIKLEENSGPSKARNIGILCAKGEYIAFNDSDTIWDYNKLELQIERFADEIACGMVYCRYGLDMTTWERIIPSMRYDKEHLEGDIYHQLLVNNTVGAPTMLIKKEVIDDVGMFREDMGALEDYEFALRIAQKYKIGFVDKVLMRSIYSEKGVNTNNVNRIDGLVKIYQAYRHSMDKIIRMNAVKVFLTELVKNPSMEKQQEFLCEFLKIDLLDRDIVEWIYKEKREEEYRRTAYENLLKSSNKLSQFKECCVAIYGKGQLGTLLEMKLKDNGCKNIYFIDRDVRPRDKSNVYTLQTLPEEVEVIINTLSEFIISNDDIQGCSGKRSISMVDVI